MRRKLFRNLGNGIDQEFPFEIDADTTFLIKNETTAAQQVFTYAEVIDGTYDAWLNGANGGILEWRSNGNILVNGFATELVRLKSNGGNPYLNDWSQGAHLKQIKPINMSQDWIITLILDKELNSNNQRLNLGVRQNSTNLLGVQLYGGTCAVIIDKASTSATQEADYEFGYPYNDLFKLFTFSRIGGVFSAAINNAGVTLNNSTWYILTNSLPDNSIVLGSRGDNTGKITNYKHLKVITGDLSRIDLSAYNQSIMTKYGL